MVPPWPHGFESNQGGIETLFTYSSWNKRMGFESNQGGIETCYLGQPFDGLYAGLNRTKVGLKLEPIFRKSLFLSKFESNQGGIETILQWEMRW